MFLERLFKIYFHFLLSFLLTFLTNIFRHFNSTWSLLATACNLGKVGKIINKDRLSGDMTGDIFKVTFRKIQSKKLASKNIVKHEMFYSLTCYHYLIIVTKLRQSFQVEFRGPVTHQRGVLLEYQILVILLRIKASYFDLIIGFNILEIRHVI